MSYLTLKFGDLLSVGNVTEVLYSEVAIISSKTPKHQVVMKILLSQRCFEDQPRYLEQM